MGSVETYSLYCLIYIIPGTIFYLIFAFRLFTKNSKELKSPFFGILKILAFVDLAELLFSCITMRMGYLLSQISFLQPPGQYNIISTFLVFGTVVFNGIQATLHVVLAFNRLTAILFPHGYRKLWNGKYFYLIISIAFIFPSFMYSWILYFGGNVLFSPVFNSFAVDGMRTGIPWLRKSTVHAAIISSTCILAFTFDLFTFVLLKKGNLFLSNVSKYKQEFRLLTVSIAFLIVHTLFLFTAIYTFAFPIHDGVLLLIFLQSTTELQCLISPFCVLLLNQNFRRDFLNPNSKNSTVNITVAASSRPTFNKSVTVF